MIGFEHEILTKEQLIDIENKITNSKISIKDFEDKKISIEEYERIQIEAQEARKKIIEHNLKFVISIVRGYKIPRNEEEDAINEGVLGLIKAAEKWNPELSAFTTYAKFYIDQQILQFINNHRNIKIPQYLLDELKHVKQGIKILEDNNQEISVANLAKLTGKPESKIENILSAKTFCEQNTFSINDHSNDNEEINFYDIESNELSPDMELLEKEDIQDAITSINRILNKREREILELYHKENKTLEEIGLVTSLSKERVRQIKEDSINKLLKHAGEKYVESSFGGNFLQKKQ
jgi:RNA polymerase sigma factor (sigma-70 family)